LSSTESDKERKQKKRGEMFHTVHTLFFGGAVLCVFWGGALQPHALFSLC
jgi:hypothetical protein